MAQFVDIPSTLGYLSFTDSSNVVFSAVAAAVPEPAGAALLVAGLGALGGVRRVANRRRVAATAPCA